MTVMTTTTGAAPATVTVTVATVTGATVTGATGTDWDRDDRPHRKKKKSSFLSEIFEMGG